MVAQSKAPSHMAVIVILFSNQAQNLHLKKLPRMVSKILAGSTRSDDSSRDNETDESHRKSKLSRNT